MVPVAFNLAALPLVSAPDGLLHPHAALHAGHPRLLQQLDRRQRRLLRPADLADPVPANPVHTVGHRQPWLLYRYYRTRDPLFWFTTSSGVLLLWSWLVLSLAQGYYSMMLFPFLMTVVLPNSVIRNWPAWLGVYGFLTMDQWLLFNWMYIGRPLEYLKITYGWSLLLIVVFTVLYFRYRTPRPRTGWTTGSIRPG